jgi:hypothetical protein
MRPRRGWEACARKFLLNVEELHNTLHRYKILTVCRLLSVPICGERVDMYPSTHLPSSSKSWRRFLPIETLRHSTQRGVVTEAPLLSLLKQNRSEWLPGPQAPPAPRPPSRRHRRGGRAGYVDAAAESEVRRRPVPPAPGAEPMAETRARPVEMEDGRVPVRGAGIGVGVDGMPEARVR